MRLTQKGHKMSPRMERLWRYIQDELGLPLNDWSTDQCVENEQVRLKAGEEKLVRQIAATQPPSLDLEHLLIDYRVIMNRRPSARMGNAQLAESEKKALAARASGTDAIGDQIREKA